MAKLNFSIVANLLSKGVEEGAAKVKSALNGIKMQALNVASVLGMGLGLKELTSTLLSSAKAMATARQTLKNITQTTAEFNAEQKYLTELSKTYNQDLINTTNAYAQFKASADQAGMSMENQHKIYSALVKASKAFSLDQESANGVMLALSQMMGKGKVSMEELRKQMGEKLPIAVQAMAKGLGVTVAELDKLVSSGQVASNDALPKFAEALDKMAKIDPTVKLPSDAETELKNQMTEIAEKLDMKGIYTDIVSKVAEIVEFIGNSLEEIKNLVIAVIFGSIANRSIKFYAKLKAQQADYTEKAKILADQRVAQEEVVATKKNEIEMQKTIFEKAEGSKRLTASRRLNKMKIALKREEAKLHNIIEAEKTAVSNAAAMGAAKGWKGAFAIIKAKAKSLATTMNNVVRSFAPMMIVTAISEIVFSIISWQKELKKIHRLEKDIKAEIAKPVHNPEIDNLRDLLSIINDTKKSTKERENAINKAASAVGIEISKTDSLLTKQRKVNEAVKNRIKLLELESKQQFAQQKKADLQSEIFDMKMKYDKSDMSDSDFAAYLAFKKDSKPKSFATKLFGSNSLLDGISPTTQDLERLTKYTDVIKTLEKETKKITEDLIKAKSSESSPNTTTQEQESPSTIKEKQSNPVKDAEDKYVKAVKEASNQLSAGVITQKEANKKIKDASRTAVEELGGLLGDKAERNAVFRTAFELAKESSEIERQVQQAEKEYRDEMTRQANLLASGAINIDEYNSATVEASKGLRKQVGALLGSEAKTNGAFIQAGIYLQGKSPAMPKEEKRDTTFDYKKSEADKLRELIALRKKYIDDLKREMPTAIDEISKAIDSIPDMEKKLKLAEIREDLKALHDQYMNDVKTLVGTSVQGIQTVYSSIKGLKDIMSSDNATTFEKIMGVIDMAMRIISVIDAITTAINAVRKTSAALTAVNAANLATQQAQVAVGAEAIATTTAQSVAEAALAKSAAAAAVALAAKNAAMIPGAGIFAAPIAASTAAAGISSAIASVSLIPTFANGGIIPGNSTHGDNVLARVNSGEMILNKRQQARLFKMIGDGKVGGSTVVVGGELTADARKLRILLKETERKIHR